MNRAILYRLLLCISLALLLFGCSASSNVTNSTSSNVSDLITFQEGNKTTETRFLPKQSNSLLDNRIGAIASDMLTMPGGNASQFLAELTSHGLKRFKWSVNELDAAVLPDGTMIGIDWDESEFDIPQFPGGPDEFATGLVENGIISTYVLTFWDKANHDAEWQPPYQGYSRFKTEEEIQRYLEYVRFVVRHFKDRIQYYEIWNENDRGGPLQHIKVSDYINLVKRTVPVIRQEYPEAKIVVGSIVLQDSPSRDYLFGILESDIMPLVDVISWHPMFSVSPEYDKDYYYQYPSLVQQIKDVASAHGFKGEYRGEELTFRSPDCFWCYSGDYLYSNIVAAKYTARGIVMHLGMDLSTGVSGLSSIRSEMFTVIRNLSTLMAGARPASLSIDIQSTATNIRSYSFSLPDGSELVALWTDGAAVDDDPGVKATITPQNLSVQKVIGIDILHSLEQSLMVKYEDSNLVIHDLLIKDYPIFIHLFP